MFRVDKSLGLKSIREFGLSNFPDDNFYYFIVDGGVIAVRPFLDGCEMHVAFHDRSKVRKSCDKFCRWFGGKWFAIIDCNKKSLINGAKKIGFVKIKELIIKSSIDGKTKPHALLKRG